MNVRVRLFAAAKQAAGRDMLDVELPEDATVGQLRVQLEREIPLLAGLIRRAAFAVDAEYATDARQIAPGADVACIPPVSGG